MHDAQISVKYDFTKDSIQIAKLFKRNSKME